MDPVDPDPKHWSEVCEIYLCVCVCVCVGGGGGAGGQRILDSFEGLGHPLKVISGTVHICTK